MKDSYFCLILEARGFYKIIRKTKSGFYKNIKIDGYRTNAKSSESNISGLLQKFCNRYKLSYCDMVIGGYEIIFTFKSDIDLKENYPEHFI